jgi:hypothetical protein
MIAAWSRKTMYRLKNAPLELRKNYFKAFFIFWLLFYPVSCFCQRGQSSDYSRHTGKERQAWKTLVRFTVKFLNSIRMECAKDLKWFEAEHRTEERSVMSTELQKTNLFSNCMPKTPDEHKYTWWTSCTENSSQLFRYEVTIDKVQGFVFSYFTVCPRIEHY